MSAEVFDKNPVVTQDTLVEQQQLAPTFFKDLKQFFCQDYSLNNYDISFWDITENGNLVHWQVQPISKLWLLWVINELYLQNLFLVLGFI